MTQAAWRRCGVAFLACLRLSSAWGQPPPPARMVRTSRTSRTVRTVQGVVTQVTDGDSLWITPPGLPGIEVRLRDIDAPEICQIWGEQARRALEELVLGKTVVLSIAGRDTYGLHAGAGAGRRPGRGPQNGGGRPCLEYSYALGPWAAGETGVRCLGALANVGRIAVMGADVRGKVRQRRDGRRAGGCHCSDEVTAQQPALETDPAPGTRRCALGVEVVRRDPRQLAGLGVGAVFAVDLQQHLDRRLGPSTLRSAPARSLRWRSSISDSARLRAAARRADAGQGFQPAG